MKTEAAILPLLFHYKMTNYMDKKNDRIAARIEIISRGRRNSTQQDYIKEREVLSIEDEQEGQ